MKSGLFRHLTLWLALTVSLLAVASLIADAPDGSGPRWLRAQSSTPLLWLVDALVPLLLAYGLAARARTQSQAERVTQLRDEYRKQVETLLARAETLDARNRVYQEHLNSYGEDDAPYSNSSRSELKTVPPEQAPRRDSAANPNPGAATKRDSPPAANPTRRTDPTERRTANRNRVERGAKSANHGEHGGRKGTANEPAPDALNTERPEYLNAGAAIENPESVVSGVMGNSLRFEVAASNGEEGDSGNHVGDTHNGAGNAVADTPETVNGNGLASGGSGSTRVVPRRRRRETGTPL